MSFETLGGPGGTSDIGHAILHGPSDRLNAVRVNQSSGSFILQSLSLAIQVGTGMAVIGNTLRNCFFT